MSIYLLFFFGAASTGSALWGFYARQYGVREAFLMAGVTLSLTAGSRFFAPLHSAEQHNLDPSGAWEEPEVNSDVPLDHGPIMVTVEYEVDEADGPAFREALEKLRLFRYQNGIVQWGFFVDIADPGKYREVYFEESWGAHLRHHERVTAYETEVASNVYAFHRGEGMPPVFHHAMCGGKYPAASDGPECTPPRRYETDSRGIPLWFVEELQET